MGEVKAVGTVVGKIRVRLLACGTELPDVHFDDRAGRGRVVATADQEYGTSCLGDLGQGRAVAVPGGVLLDILRRRPVLLLQVGDHFLEDADHLLAARRGFLDFDQIEAGGSTKDGTLAVDPREQAGHHSAAPAASHQSHAVRIEER